MKDIVVVALLITGLCVSLFFLVTSMTREADEDAVLRIRLEQCEKGLE